MKIAFIKNHGVVVLLVVVAALNVLVQQKVLHLSGGLTDTLNVFLGALGIGVHVSNK
jgi:hypothetical protein